MFKKILLAIIIIIIILIAALMLMLDSIAKHSIEKLGSSTLHTPVEVGSVRISLLKGTGTLSNLTIANPAGYPAGHLLSVNEIQFKIDLASVLSPTIHIPLIIVESPTVSLMTGRDTTNINALMDGMSSEATPAKNKPSSSSTSPAGSGKKVMIDQLKITNVHVNANVTIAQAALTIPHIEVDNIGKNGGVSVPQAMVIGLKALLNGVLNSAGVPEMMHNIGSALKGLFNH